MTGGAGQSQPGRKLVRGLELGVDLLMQLVALPVTMEVGAMWGQEGGQVKGRVRPQGGQVQGSYGVWGLWGVRPGGHQGWKGWQVGVEGKLLVDGAREAGPCRVRRQARLRAGRDRREGRSGGLVDHGVLGLSGHGVKRPDSIYQC